MDLQVTPRLSTLEEAALKAASQCKMIFQCLATHKTAVGILPNDVMQRQQNSDHGEFCALAKHSHIMLLEQVHND